MRILSNKFLQYIIRSIDFDMWGGEDVELAFRAWVSN